METEGVPSHRPVHQGMAKDLIPVSSSACLLFKYTYTSASAGDSSSVQNTAKEVPPAPDSGGGGALFQIVSEAASDSG